MSSGSHPPSRAASPQLLMRDGRPQSFRLLDLPQEIRDQILCTYINGKYDISVLYPYSNSHVSHIEGPPFISNLALVCKKLRHDIYKVRAESFTGEIRFHCSSSFDFGNVMKFSRNFKLRWAAERITKVVLDHLFNKSMHSWLHSSLLDFQRLQEIVFVSEMNLYLHMYAGNASLNGGTCGGLKRSMSDFTAGKHDQAALNSLKDYRLQELADRLQKAGRQCKVLLQHTFYVRPMADRWYGPMPAGLLHTVVSVAYKQRLDRNFADDLGHTICYQSQFDRSPYPRAGDQALEQRRRSSRSDHRYRPRLTDVRNYLMEYTSWGYRKRQP